MAAQPLLIVDDDATIGAVLADILGIEGYAVERASSRQEALTLLSARGADAFGLVVSDSFTPRSDPYGWLDQLRARTTAAVVICSGWPQELFADYRARGYAAFLPKPFEVDDFIALVASLCRQTPA